MKKVTNRVKEKRTGVKMQKESKGEPTKDEVRRKGWRSGWTEVGEK